MNRRGVLGILGIGAAAGPAVVKQYASDVVPSTGGYNFADKAELVQWNPVEALAEAKKDYEAITLDPEAWIADFVQREWKEYMDGYTSHSIKTIDPDIRNMKSLSESAKMRMYFERKAKRKQAQYAESAWGRVQEWMNKV
jgi:hypothetical protein